MNCQEFELDIDDYVDQRLGRERRTAFEDHLRICAACRAAVTDLRTLVAAIDRLEPQHPSSQVWTRIAAAIEKEERSSGLLERLRLTATSRRLALSAAAVVCIVVAGAWMAFRDAASSYPIHRDDGAVARPSPVRQPVGTVVDAAASDYASAITSLERIANSNVDALGAPTAGVVRDNLAVLDTAIRESQQAFDTNPANDVARDSLLDALRTKVSLLQDTVALINDVRSAGDGSDDTTSITQERAGSAP
jgi:hypothetical protein